MITEINQQEFDREVVNATGPVLIDFYAAWCGPCKLVGPILEEVSRERPDIKIVKVNVDEEPELARQHRVMSIPTLVLYQGGKMAANWIGLRAKPVLLRDLDAALVKP
jgi:thioredoxin 1